MCIYCRDDSIESLRADHRFAVMFGIKMSRYQKAKNTWWMKGRILWLAVMTASLIFAGRIGTMDVWRRVLERAIEPACGLPGYLEDTTAEEKWREILIGMLCYPMPISGYLGQVEMGEVSVSGDPIYDKYQSSDLLYNGGQIILPGESTETEGSGHGREPGDSLSTELPSGDDTSTAPESTEKKEETSGQGEQVIETHLPNVISGKRYTRLQLQNFKYLLDQLYLVHSSTTVYPSQLDVDTLLSKNLTIDRQGKGAQILIHHTHGTEGFANSGTGGGKTILEVGDYLTDLLTGYGYKVIHDRSIYPYDTAYSEAQVRVKKILAENPSIQLVIDLHRDATASQAHRIATVNGEVMAPLMFFNGMCQTPDGPIDYLSNPYLEDNLALSLQMKLIAEAYYPGLTRPNFLKAYQYNQHLLPRYTLIEAGFDTNTFEEVCRSMEPLANILDAVLSDPKAANGCVWE